MKNKIKQLNYFLSEKYSEKYMNTPGVLCFLMHKIYPAKKDVSDENGTVAEGLTVEDFETFIRYFKERDFNFIDENDLIGKTPDPSGKYIYVTFDDGYFNNFNALPVLQKYDAKATFYISTNHCLQEKTYWWDALYSLRRKQNVSAEKIAAEVEHFYTLHWKEQDALLMKEFGAAAFRSNNDLMRPMTPRELKKFASSPGVVIGNHTDNHLNLSIYNESEVSDAVLNAHRFISETTGTAPRSLAYPYGFFSDATKQVLSRSGYRIGHTCIGGKNAFSDTDLLEFKRNALSGFFNIEEQCRNLHVNFSLFQRLKKTLLLK